MALVSPSLLGHSVIQQQIDTLRELYKYVEDPYVSSVDQEDVRARCLREWHLPESAAGALVRLKVPPPPHTHTHPGRTRGAQRPLGTHPRGCHG